MTESEASAMLTPTPMSKFTKFPELPTELRLKIWGLASKTQRLLVLQYCIVDRKFFSFQKLPPILHTSKESRVVGLCYYHLSFGTDKHPPDTYFNSVNDIIYFGSEQYGDEIDFMIRHFDKQRGSLEPLDQIQNLALGEYLWQRDYKYSPFATWRGNWSIRKFARTFPHLKHLICVKGCTVPFDGEEASIEHPVTSGNYDAPTTLVKSRSGYELIRDPNIALGDVISAFRASKQESPERQYPEVAVMEIQLL
ncbi:hypothetical protein N431DRAFT_332142 [Stipitochalara longipes BDJ]|nr:hypothetical protein N431DRAFT_332142 [Stipitochalara longipes BDJ]